MSLHVLPIPSNMAVWAWRGVVTFALAAMAVAIVLVAVALPAASVDTTPLHSDAPIVRQQIVAAPPPELTALDICLDPDAEKAHVVGLQSRYEVRLRKPGPPTATGQETSVKYTVVVSEVGNVLSPSAAIETEKQGEFVPFRSEDVTQGLADCLSGAPLVQEPRR